MNYKMVNTTFFVNYINKLLGEFITVVVIYTKSTFNCAGNLNLKFCERILTFSLIVFIILATKFGSFIKHAPKAPSWTRSDGQPTLRLISSYPAS